MTSERSTRETATPAAVRAASGVVLLLALAAAPAAAQNLLTNGAFTTDISGWGLPGPGVDVLYRGADGSTLPDGSGPGCLEIRSFIHRGGSTGTWQNVAVEAGRSYRLAASYYCPASPDNLADDVVLAVFWRSAAGGDVDWATTSARPPEVDTWSRLTLDLLAPAGAVTASVNLMVGTPNLTGETRPGVAYFDDAHFGPLDGAAVVDVMYLPAAAAAPGIAGTYWSTALWASSLADSPVTLRAAMLPQDTDNTTAFDVAQPVGTIPPRGHLEVADVVGALGGSGTGGLLVIAEADAGETPLVRVASRTSTPNEHGAGSYGQGIAAVRGSASGTQVAPGAVVDDGFRTNAGALNLSATTLRLEVAVVDASGAEVVSRTWTLPPYAHHQASLSSTGVVHLEGGSVVFRCLSNPVPFTSYISVVDEGTGDPTFVAAE